MSRFIKTVLCITLSAAILTGCAKASVSEDTSATSGTSSAATDATSASSESTTTSASETTTSSTEETSHVKQEGHYKFKDHVYPKYMDEMMGKKIHEAYDNYIDAVLAGEDYFECADQNTYDWMLGQCAYACHPVIARFTGTCYGDGYKNGKGKIRYDLPKEEVKQKIEEFKVLIEGILNETLEDDYSDFEKALALYIYFDENYTYDYYAMENYTDDQLWGYRVFMEKQGICQEFSIAYSFLLLQAGVDATVMKGNRSYDNQGHQWSYVTINGKYYQIDPTYVIGSGNSLAYFMMDDAQRTEEDTYVPANCTLCNHYGRENIKNFKRDKKYDCTDDSYKDLWRGFYESIDTEKNILSYTVWETDDTCKTYTFDYGALESGQP